MGATYAKCMTTPRTVCDAVCSQLEFQFVAASLVCGTIAVVIATCMGLWVMDAVIYMQSAAWRAGRVRRYARRKILAAGASGDWQRQVDQEAERMLNHPHWGDIWWR
jgi:hypothetical protein